MSDQADQLRELVRSANAVADAAAPEMVVVGGGRTGVGSTTVALDLSRALAAQQRSVVLVDADLERADATRRFGIEQCVDGSLSDVLAGRRTAAEVIQNGPAGVRILPGQPHDSRMISLALGNGGRVPQEIIQLGGRCDVVIVDTAGGLTPFSERFWQAARLVIAVTTPDDAAVMDTYAMLKSASRGPTLPGVRILVNRCQSFQQADNVHQRIGQACFRFLGELVPALPPLPAREPSEGRTKSNVNANYRESIQRLARCVAEKLHTTHHYSLVA